jgi:hypothetical protein
MQRNFEPIANGVEAWQRSELTDVTAKVVIYKAFVEGAGSPETPYPHRPRPVLRAEVRGVPVEDDLESVGWVHVSLQGTRPDSPI